MWVGVTTQKNGLGRLCVISAFFLVWAIIRAWSQRKQTGVKWKIRTDLAVLLLALLLLRGPGGGYSATSIVALLLGTDDVSRFVMDEEAEFEYEGHCINGRHRHRRLSWDINPDHRRVRSFRLCGHSWA